MKHSGTPYLETDRLILRRFESGDAAALRAVMDFLFGVVGVNRVELRHDPRNPHSGGVMKKCGMKYEGTLRCADRNNQGICDACYYGMLREEWEERRDKPGTV